MHEMQYTTGRLHNIHPSTQGECRDVIGDIYFLMARYTIPHSKIRSLTSCSRSRNRIKQLRERMIEIGNVFFAHVEEAIQRDNVIEDPHWKEQLVSLSSEFFVRLDALNTFVESMRNKSS